MRAARAGAARAEPRSAAGGGATLAKTNAPEYADAPRRISGDTDVAGVIYTYLVSNTRDRRSRRVMDDVCGVCAYPRRGSVARDVNARRDRLVRETGARNRLFARKSTIHTRVTPSSAPRGRDRKQSVGGVFLRRRSPIDVARREGTRASRFPDARWRMNPPPSDPLPEEEELQTTAEKESWLRARGVEIESPEDRRKAADAKAKLAHPLDHVEGVTRRVKYVKIPCDASLPFEQLEAILAHDAHGDILPDVLAPRFAGAARSIPTPRASKPCASSARRAWSCLPRRWRTPRSRARRRRSRSCGRAPRTDTGACTCTLTRWAC